jgi:type II secretory pathway pseudopilin PulG
LENKGVSSTSKTYKKPSDHPKNGFILLEVLIAMSLMTGAWMTLIQSYQTLSLKLMQQEQERVRLTNEWNASELSFVSKRVISEPSRMSSRSRTLHATAQPATQIQR